MKYPAKKKRDWLEKVKKEGLLKNKKDTDEEEVDPNRPPLLDNSMWLWRAFNLLNARRNYGPNGPQPISLSDIAAYVVLENLDKHEATWLMDVIDVLDRIYIEDAFNKLAKERDKASKKGRGTARGSR